MENIEDIREQIEELEKRIAEIEDQARQKEVLEKERLEAEYESKFDKIKEETIESNKKLELALTRYDEIIGKRDDLKYKVKQTGRGKELLKEVVERVKSEKARINDIKDFIKGYSDYTNDLKKEMTKKLSIFVKNVNSEKKSAIASIKKDIKALNKEIATIEKSY